MILTPMTEPSSAPPCAGHRGVFEFGSFQWFRDIWFPCSEMKKILSKAVLGSSAHPKYRLSGKPCFLKLVK